MIITVVTGVITGFFISIPPLGPISFSLISKGFNNKVKEGMGIGTGAAFMDFVYCMVAFGGISLLFSLLPESVLTFYFKNISLIQIILTYTGCLIVVFYGIRIIRTKITYNELESRQFEKITEAKEKAIAVEEKAKEFAKQHHVPVVSKSSLSGLFIMGILLCLSSITLPASWFAVVGYLKGYGLINSSLLDGLYFSIGVFLGTSGWFYTLLKLITGNKHRISPSSVNKLNIASGVVLIMLGIFLFAKASGITISSL
jgi:threonine/homoserine/homoserine lactone efflux protein